MLSVVMIVVTYGLLFGATGLACTIFLGRLYSLIRLTGKSKSKVLGFFHPYCNAGGGGERVLWQCVSVIVNRCPDIEVVIYTGDCDAKPAQMLARAKDRFNINDIGDDAKIRFVYLRTRFLVEASLYPRFTLMGQSVGSIMLGMEALIRCPCHIFFDSMGYAFTHPLASVVFGCEVGCYVHYPTISTDMLQRVTDMRPSYNNDQRIAGSRTASTLKSIYYQLFARLYAMAGQPAKVVMVNSSWTKEHITHIWSAPHRVTTVFPPCNTRALQTTSLTDERKDVVISIGQFRPEKDHRLQLEAFAQYTKSKPHSKTKLILIGGCRDAGDKARVADLREQAEKLGITNRVEFATNIPFSDLLEHLRTARVGMHTMWNEHFGIGVVELMAAGVITIAHNSGGPKMDILAPFAGTVPGFLARTVEEYADALEAAFDTSIPRDEMRRHARSRADDFSDEAFSTSFAAALVPLLR